MNDFVWLGFNEDTTGKKVFDGVENWIAAGTGIGLNYRFAQSHEPSETGRTTYTPKRRSRSPTFDDRRLDGQDGQPRQALPAERHLSEDHVGELGQRVLGEDRVTGPHRHRGQRHCGSGERPLLPDLVDQHTVSGNPPNSPGMCARPRNTIDPNPGLRALFVAMDQWIDGVAPPQA